MVVESMTWAWYVEAYELLWSHLQADHADKWEYNDDEMRMFEEEFVYGEFKHNDSHEVSCPWCDCDWSVKFTTRVSMVVVKDE